MTQCQRLADLLKISQNSVYRWSRGETPSAKNGEKINLLLKYLKRISAGYTPNTRNNPERIRQKLGLKPMQMAQFLEISQATLRRWESGSVPTLRRSVSHSNLTEHIQFIKNITKYSSHYDKYNRG